MSEQEEKEACLKPFKFKKGQPICPFCFEPAQTVKAEEGATWYTCPCDVCIWPIGMIVTKKYDVPYNYSWDSLNFLYYISDMLLSSRNRVCWKEICHSSALHLLRNCRGLDSRQLACKASSCEADM